MAWLVVVQLDEDSFRALHAEYAEKNSCAFDAETLLALAGGTPGILPGLCTGIDAAEKRLTLLLQELDALLIEAKNLV